jgi:2-polyprenyl-3-methyl-5-hydroxy-6-metoxy-1,4-benzoquinol methylase
MFAPVRQCWICGGTSLERFHLCRMDFREYATQDPELNAYSGQRVWLVRCARCRFGQPEQLPTLPGFFERMYDQRWAEDWVEREFDSPGKDFIFRHVLSELDTRVTSKPRRLLDVGAHAGRFMHLAQARNWVVEGVELNPRTAACASRRTGAPVHQVNAHTLGCNGHRYAAVTLTDVLEHIPEPRALLTSLNQLIEPGGWIAVKVPCGPSQLMKERALAAVSSHKVSLAENLVHVNHFSPRSLKLALDRAGFSQIRIRTGAPELLPRARVRHSVSNGLRLVLYAAGNLPGAVETPLALNLQAYATKPIAGQNWPSPEP